MNTWKSFEVMTEYKKVFVDTAPIVYFLQEHELYFEKTRKIFYYLCQTYTSFVSSDITIAEYLVKLYRENNLRGSRKCLKRSVKRDE